MSEAIDVAIVGGGVIGSAIACFLAGEPGFAGRILVIEPDPSYRTASTTLSAASIRQQFSTPENIRIGQFGAAFIRDATRHLSVEGEVVDLAFREAGYLFLASPAGAGVLASNHALQRALGCDNLLLDAEGLKARFPWLETEGIAAGCLGLSGEGWFDNHGLLMAFRRKARSLGAEYRTDRVVGMTVAGGRVVRLALESGAGLSPGVVVNAAGPRAGQVAALAGIDLPVRPRKRFVYVIHCRDVLAPALPLVIEPGGVYVRPEGQHYICGVSPPPDQDPDCDDLEVEYGLFEEVVWPVLAARIPALAAVKLVNAWAGHYDYNTVDQNAIIGPHPELANLIFANGFSGHGLQQAPAVGRAVAELIAFGRYRSLDLSRFRYTRFAEGDLVIEKNVV